MHNVTLLTSPVPVRPPYRCLKNGICSLTVCQSIFLRPIEACEKPELSKTHKS
jgi:hypothetical protein